MKATVNGQDRELPDGATVAMLLEMLGAPKSGVAVACNDAVVRRGEYEGARLREGDRVEIITAAAGG